MSKKQQAPKREGGVKRVLKKIGVVLATLLLIAVTTGVILCGYGAIYIQDVIIPQVKSSSANLVSSSTDLSSIIYYYDTDSKSYEPLQTLYAQENRIWVTYDQIPENLINATVAIEDKRFYKHNGVDWKRTGAAVLYMFTGQRIEGGSTITQQLIKNLTQQTQVTVRRKVLEIFEALQFDRTHTKSEILEWYLNEIYLGRGCFGVKTAAQKYFGKDVSELDLAECAALISITNNPSLYDPYNHPENNLRRRTLVLKSMAEQGYISEEECATATAEELNFTTGSQTDSTGESSGSYYTWYTDAVIESVIDGLQQKYDYDEKTAAQLLYSGGFRIYSCLNKNIQREVDRIYSNVDSVAGWSSVKGEQLQSSITVVDNTSGKVIALAGGVGEKVGNRIWNRATDTLRQPGSSLKPLSAYSQALENEEQDLLPNSIFSDTPMTTVNGREWPKNSHGGYQGNVDMTYAVEQSLNTVAVKTIELLGLQNSYDFLTEKFGLSTLVDEYVGTTGKVYSDVGYSQLGLGGLTRGVSTYEMASAYSTFPRKGVYISPYLYTVVLNSKGETILATEGYEAEMNNEIVTIKGSAAGEAIVSTSTSYYMTEMLESVVESGTGTAAAIDGMPVAGKTGTTDDDYDRWFVGYMPYYTAAVWTGYDRASKIQSSYNPAVELWQKVMSAVSAGMIEKSFDEEYQTVEVTYCGRCGGIAGKKSVRKRTFAFLKGDEPDYACTCGGSGKKPAKEDEEKDKDTDEEENATGTPLTPPEGEVIDGDAENPDTADANAGEETTDGEDDTDAYEPSEDEPTDGEDTTEPEEPAEITDGEDEPEPEE